MDDKKAGDIMIHRKNIIGIDGAQDLIDVPDRPRLRIHPLNLLCQLPRRKIKLMCDEHISLRGIDRFSCQQPTHRLIIRKTDTVLVGSENWFYHGRTHKRKQIKMNRSAGVL